MEPIAEALLAGNRRFVAHDWDPADANKAGSPARRLAVVACMDTRYTVERVLGLEHGDAKIIRNAGNRIDDGALRSLVVAVHGMGVEHVAVLGHTKCGMIAVARGEVPIADRVAQGPDVQAAEVARPEFQRWLGGFEDVEENIRRSVALVRDHPYLPDDLDVFGLVYDNDTGVVHQVT